MFTSGFEIHWFCMHVSGLDVRLKKELQAVDATALFSLARRLMKEGDSNFGVCVVCGSFSPLRVTALQCSLNDNGPVSCGLTKLSTFSVKLRRHAIPTAYFLFQSSSNDEPSISL